MKPTNKKHNIIMSNHLEEYFAEASQSKEVLTSKELFKANNEDVDIKTELNIQEIVLINKLKFNSQILLDAGLDDVYKDFLINYLLTNAVNIAPTKKASPINLLFTFIKSIKPSAIRQILPANHDK